MTTSLFIQQANLPFSELLSREASVLGDCKLLSGILSISSDPSSSHGAPFSSRSWRWTRNLGPAQLARGVCPLSRYLTGSLAARADAHHVTHTKSAFLLRNLWYTDLCGLERASLVTALGAEGELLNFLLRCTPSFSASFEAEAVRIAGASRGR